jgi:STE24 endopeptidase
VTAEVSRDQRRERVVPYMAVALALAVAGIVATVARPVAPPLPAGTPELATFDPAVMETIAAYRTPRQIAALVAVVITVLVPVLVVVTATGRRLVTTIAGERDHAPLRGGALAAAILALVDLVTLPLVIWIGFIHETDWGFRTNPFSGFMRDWAVSRAPGWLLAAAGVALLLWGIARWPRSWHWRAAVAGTGVAALLVVVSPLVFEPLMLRTEPLEEGEVHEGVDEVLLRAGLADTPILVGDASRRTLKANAYVSGLGPSRRVVLYDTLAALPPETVAAVVAHEIAHDRHRDIERVILLGATGLAIALPLLRLVIGSPRGRRLVSARGPTDPRLVAVGAAVVAVLWLVSLPVSSSVSRTLEAAADRGAVELTADPASQVRLRRAFVLRDLSDPAPPTWYRILIASHPPSGDRIHAAVVYAEEIGVELPTLADLEAEESEIRHSRIP